MNLLFVSLAPVFIVAFYVYYRDKYEKEPIKLLLLSLILGGLTPIPVIFLEEYLMGVGSMHTGYAKAFWDGFVVAAFSEELFKWLVFMLLIWRNKNFNEKMDGIVYAVFISLGFAAVENLLYVFGAEDGHSVGLVRAITAVPAHALFGIAMGFHFGLARFSKSGGGNLMASLLVPIILHGIYDFLLMAEKPFLLLVFVVYVVFLWIFGFRRIKKHVQESEFKDSPPPTK